MGKKKRPVTHVVNLSLPQSRDKTVDKLYRLLRNRTREKSQKDRSDVGIRAELLVIEFVVRGIARPTGVSVIQGSFVPLVEQGKEMGFTAKIDSVLGTGTLRVFKTGEAYVEEDWKPQPPKSPHPGAFSFFIKSRRTKKPSDKRTVHPDSIRLDRWGAFYESRDRPRARTMFSAHWESGRSPTTSRKLSLQWQSLMSIEVTKEPLVPADCSWFVAACALLIKSLLLVLCPGLGRVILSRTEKCQDIQLELLNWLCQYSVFARTEPRMVIWKGTARTMSTTTNDILENLQGGNQAQSAPPVDGNLSKTEAKTAPKDAEDKEESSAPELSISGLSLEKGRRDIEAGILADTRRRILELALMLEKGEVTEKVIEETQASLQKIAAEIGRSKGKDELFNYPLLDNIGRVVFEDLPLVFGKDAQVESALKVLQKVFRQRYNAVIVVDASRKALGIIPSAVLINSDPEETLGKIPTVTKGFSVTLDSKPEEVTAIMDRLGVNVLPVVDSKGIVIGTFTSRDHVKGVAALYSRQLMETLKTHGMLAQIQQNMENPSA